VAGCAFDVAVMTNVTPEHLDFHGSFDEYIAAKARLFAMLGETPEKGYERFGVVNADDKTCEVFRSACPVSVLSYGIGARADVRASRLRLRPDGSSFVVDSDLGRHEVDTRFVGHFNVANWLAAIAVAIGRGIPWGAVEQAARVAEPPAGRLEPVEMGQPFGVWVDFAHTPQALRAVLQTARMVTAGRVIAVFGAAGERYAENRPEMGAIAAELADDVCVTTDDPYSEEPSALAAAVVAGAPGAHVILDRRAAIAAALGLAGPGDLVVIAGRGHERFQMVGGDRRAFDDVSVARELLRQLRSRQDRSVTRAG
jgi:UDP-N-acetylmuramoyl-L-alanyl-D-glutamate--2,6-diaminopimelate ligase